MEFNFVVDNTGNINFHLISSTYTELNSDHIILFVYLDVSDWWSNRIIIANVNNTLSSGPADNYPGNCGLLGLFEVHRILLL